MMYDRKFPMRQYPLSGSLISCRESASGRKGLCYLHRLVVTWMNVRSSLQALQEQFDSLSCDIPMQDNHQRRIQQTAAKRQLKVEERKARWEMRRKFREENEAFARARLGAAAQEQTP